MNKLNLGCGLDVKSGWTNLDLENAAGIDIAHDLNEYPWPIEDNSYEYIYCSHVLEHLDDFFKAMDEIYRISSPGCKLIVKAPYHVSMKALSDPEHKTRFVWRTFNRYTVNTPKEKGFGYQSDANVRLKAIKRRIIFPFKREKYFTGWVSPIINILPMIYERYFFFIFPAQEIYYEFEVQK